MNLNYQELLPADFDKNSKVWIYQSNRLFSFSEALQIEEILNGFTKNWLSHGAPVKGYGNLFFGQFIILMADESATTVGGCSTDSSVHVIKQIEQQFKVNLFDRQLLAFLVKDKIQLVPISQLNYAIENHFIDEDTLYFNNTVLTKKELESNWMVPVRKSWLAKKINGSQTV
ncbi:MAG: hypothetical protein JST58_06610 [Bacteroidetes bacterium]|nr:hypothetical protein [Bacteroidota bacterium]